MITAANVQEFFSQMEQMAARAERTERAEHERDDWKALAEKLGATGVAVRDVARQTLEVKVSFDMELLRRAPSKEEFMRDAISRAIVGGLQRGGFR